MYIVYCFYRVLYSTALNLQQGTSTQSAGASILIYLPSMKFNLGLLDDELIMIVLIISIM